MRYNLRHPRCSRCNLRETICICSAIPKLNITTQLYVVMHSCEMSKTTNTGRLLHLALPNSKLCFHGRLDLPHNLENELQRDGSTFVLFPDNSAEEVNAEFVSKHKRPLKIVVPDGNWKQARKMSHTIPALSALPRIRIPVLKPSAYGLRRSPRNGMLCTIEAAAAALGVIEGDEIQIALEKLLGELTSRIHWSRRNQGRYEVVPEELAT